MIWLGPREASGDATGSRLTGNHNAGRCAIERLVQKALVMRGVGHTLGLEAPGRLHWGGTA